LNTSLKELKADTSCILSPAVLLDLYYTCGGYLDPIKVVLGPYTPGTFISRKGAQDLASQVMQRANLAVIENPDEFSPAEVANEKVRSFSFIPSHHVHHELVDTDATTLNCAESVREGQRNKR
jgi:hypothetical protein